MLKFAIILSFTFAILAGVSTSDESFETYFEWKIGKFLDLPTENNYELDSPQFSFANTKWYLSIFTNGSTVDKSRGFICMYLCLVDLNEAVYHIYYSLGIKSRNGSEFELVQRRHTKFSDWRKSSGVRDKLLRSALLSSKDYVSPEGALTVFCKLLITRIPNARGNISQIISNGTGHLPDNFQNLYTSKRFSDITLNVKGRKFSAHKNVLSCRLNTFGSMGENIPDTVEITDCDPDSFNEFLLFVYTGNLVKVSYEKMKSLYLTAEKYSLIELKENCARSITDHDLTIHSFYDVLNFANLHNDNVLLTAVLDFVITNSKHILATEKWKNFLLTDPLQVNNLFLRYVENKK